MSTGVQRYLDRRDKGLGRPLVTPEGVPLNLTLAGAGDRAAAFGLDVLIIYGSMLVMMLLLMFATGGSFQDSWVTPVILLFTFIVQNFYFIFFEMRWQGATPGKRMVGIRVIDGHGGSLSAESIIARNLVRDLEVFIPMQAIMMPEQIVAGGPSWARLLAVVWLGVFMLMPLFNRDRLRVGDMVGGTLVVLAPRALLLPDIGGEVVHTARRSEQGAYIFSDEQLSIYGIYELQVLEGVLRQDPGSAEYYQTVDTVCEKIKLKIHWPRDQWQVQSERFLRDFYAALRARLEKDMLFGKKKADKFSR